MAVDFAFPCHFYINLRHKAHPFIRIQHILREIVCGIHKFPYFKVQAKYILKEQVVALYSGACRLVS